MTNTYFRAELSPGFVNRIYSDTLFRRLFSLWSPGIDIEMTYTRWMPSAPQVKVCWLLVLIGVLLDCTPLRAEAVCGTPKLKIADHSTLASAKPQLEWDSVPGAVAYQLSVESRIPEGRTLATYDIRTESLNWLPPAALTDFRAVVKGTLSAICDQADGRTTRGPSTPFRFYIDTGLLCGLRANPEINAKEGAIYAEWPAVDGAEYYEVTVFSATDGKVAKRQDVRATNVQLLQIVPATDAYVVSVRPRCSAGFGLHRFKVFGRPEIF